MDFSRVKTLFSQFGKEFASVLMGEEITWSRPRFQGVRLEDSSDDEEKDPRRRETSGLLSDVERGDAMVRDRKRDYQARRAQQDEEDDDDEEGDRESNSSDEEFLVEAFIDCPDWSIPPRGRNEPLDAYCDRINEAVIAKFNSVLRIDSAITSFREQVVISFDMQHQGFREHVIQAQKIFVGCFVVPVERKSTTSGSMFGALDE